MILVKDAKKSSGYEIALITTGPRSHQAQIIERYVARYPIEVSYEDAKHLFGVGHAAPAPPRAIERTAPFQVLVMSLIGPVVRAARPPPRRSHRAPRPLP